MKKTGKEGPVGAAVLLVIYPPSHIRKPVLDKADYLFSNYGIYNPLVPYLVFGKLNSGRLPEELPSLLNGMPPLRLGGLRRGEHSLFREAGPEELYTRLDGLCEKTADFPGLFEPGIVMGFGDIAAIPPEEFSAAEETGLTWGKPVFGLLTVEAAGDPWWTGLQWRFTAGPVVVLDRGEK